MVEDDQDTDPLLFHDERDPEDGLQSFAVAGPQVIVSEMVPFMRQDVPCDLGIVARDR
jgi:hypothetical protein